MKKKAAITLIGIITVSVIITAGLYAYRVNKKIAADNLKIVALQEAQKDQIRQNNELAIFDWKGYSNDQLGFVFKYPASVFVCQLQDPAVLSLAVYHGQSCEFAKNAKDPSNIKITIAQNTRNYKTAEEAFYGEYGSYFGFDIDRSLNKELGYFKLGKLDAFGGEIVGKVQGTWVTRSNNYAAIIIKNDYIIKISDSYYDVIVDGRQSGDKAFMDVLVSSFYFDSLHEWK